jgi:hypothetical protein
MNEKEILDRIYKLFKTFLNDNTLVPKKFHPVVDNLVREYLRKADPAGVRSAVEKMRDEIIPWLLSENEDAKK